MERNLSEDSRPVRGQRLKPPITAKILSATKTKTGCLHSKETMSFFKSVKARMSEVEGLLLRAEPPLAVLLPHAVGAAGRGDHDATGLLDALRLVGPFGLVILIALVFSPLAA